VLGVTDHVHDGDTSLVQFIDGGLGGNTDGGDEEAGSLLNDDLDELGELTFGVVVLRHRVRIAAYGMVCGTARNLRWSCGRFPRLEEAGDRHRREPWDP
jgi:hypothetical protein